MDTITKLDEHSLEFAQTLQTENDFQNFVDSHPEIEMLQDLLENYRHIGYRYSNLIRAGKLHAIKFKKVRMVWSNMKNKEDLQKFIDENQIESTSVLRSNYWGFISRMRKLGFKETDFIYYPKSSEFDSITIEFAQSFINKNNIQSMNDLRKNYHKEYLLFRNVREDLKFQHDRHNQGCWKDYNTIDQFQDFIVVNEIKTRTEFLNRFPGLYGRSKAIGVLKNLSFEQDSPAFKYKLLIRFKSESDVQAYILENNILTSKQLKSTDEGMSIYNYSMARKWKIIFPGRPRDLSNYVTEDDFQKFIDENDIKSPADFMIVDSGLYAKLSKLKLTSKVKYPKRRKSSLELKISKKLKELIIEYEDEKIFPDLKDKLYLRFDFFIESKKLILEPGGLQHLTPIKWVVGERYEILRKHDQMKREYCKKNGYKILYYFENDFPSLVSTEEFKRLIEEYPGECYTKETFDQMFERILSL